METNINERIKAVLDTVFRGNVSAMAKRTFIKRTTISSIVGADQVTPGFEVVAKIADMSSPSISMEWLVRGKGPMILEDSASTSINSHNENTNINDGSTIDRLLGIIETKDKQIDELIGIIKTK